MVRSLTFFEVLWLLLRHIMQFEVFGPLTLIRLQEEFSFPVYSSAGKFCTAFVADVLAFDGNRLQTFKYFLSCGRVILGNLSASRAFSLDGKALILVIIM